MYIHMYTYINTYITCIHIATNFKELMNLKEKQETLGKEKKREKLCDYIVISKKSHIKIKHSRYQLSIALH